MSRTPAGCRELFDRSSAGLEPDCNCPLLKLSLVLLTSAEQSSVARDCIALTAGLLTFRLRLLKVDDEGLLEEDDGFGIKVE